MFKNYFVLLATIFFSTQTMSMETIINKPAGVARGLVVIAPAKKYLMRERLFSELAAKLTNEGYLTVRFNWSPDTLQVPMMELQRAARDINYIVRTAQKYYGFLPEQTILISKSFSTQAIEESTSFAKTQILLTPNCSADAPFRQVYWNVLNRTDLLLRMYISNEDPYCKVDEIRQTLNILLKASLLGVTHGDHNFAVKTPSNEISYAYQDQVVNSIAKMLK